MDETKDDYFDVSLDEVMRIENLLFPYGYKWRTSLMLGMRISIENRDTTRCCPITIEIIPPRRNGPSYYYACPYIYSKQFAIGAFCEKDAEEIFSVSYEYSIRKDSNEQSTTQKAKRKNPNPKRR